MDKQLLSIEIFYLINKIQLIENSQKYIDSNSTQLTKDDFILSSVAISQEIREIKEKLISISDTF